MAWHSWSTCASVLRTPFTLNTSHGLLRGHSEAQKARIAPGASTSCEPQPPFDSLPIFLLRRDCLYCPAFRRTTRCECACHQRAENNHDLARSPFNTETAELCECTIDGTLTRTNIRRCRARARSEWRGQGSVVPGG